MRFVKKPLRFNLILFCAFLVFATQAYAFPFISPTDPAPLDYIAPIAYGNANNQPDIDTVISTWVDTDSELYKAEVGKTLIEPVIEIGPLSGSYTTVFSNSILDPADAIIKWETNTDFVVSPAFLLVKDGKQEPAWYLFNLTIAGWNGMETLKLTGFWPDEGAISHVTLYGGNPVPEPATLLLLGAGLVGLAGFGRKKIKK